MFFSYNVWLAVVPPCVGFASLLFGGMDGMDSKPLFEAFNFFELSGILPIVTNFSKFRHKKIISCSCIFTPIIYS